MDRLYEPLQPGEIRVATIRPSADADAPIYCDLAIQELRGTPFQALSYVWGDPEIQTPITVNSAAVYITWNLALALLHLRNASSGVRLWVDALCINQSDIDERGSQVSMMHEIYEVAERVIVWLGPEENNSNQAIRWLKYWAHRMEAAGINEADPAKYNANNLNELYEANMRLSDTTKLLQIMGRDIFQGPWSLLGAPDDRSTWEALRQFFNRPWWSRLWIFQETVLAQEIVLLCGSTSMEWKDLYAHLILDIVAKVFPRYGLRNQDYDWAESDKVEERIQGPNILITWRQIFTMQRNFGVNHTAGIVPPVSLAEVISGRQCSDARDMIFGITGLLNKSEILRPDYRRSTEYVYCEFAKTEILKVTPLGQLYLLRFAGIGGAVDVPSWVPDWRRHDVNAYHLPDLYSASKGVPVSGEVSMNTRCLTLAGVEFDTVQMVELDTTDTNASCFAFEMLDECSGLYPTGCSHFQALLRTRLEDNIRKLKHAWRISPQHSREFQSLLVGALYCLVVERRMGRRKIKSINDITPLETRAAVSELQNKMDIPTDLHLGTIFPWSFEIHTAPDNALNYWPEDFVQSVNAAVNENGYTADGWHGRAQHHRRVRRLFRTNKGYFGTGPQHILKDDIVCVLFGAKTPYLLRKRRGRDGFLLVGEAYLHGIMDGELVSEDGTGSAGCYDTEKFDIY